MNREQGFTLLELMVAITIVAIITVIIFGALRIGVRAWERGERNIDSLQRTRIVADLMKRQIASACSPGVNDSKKKNKKLLRGDRKSLELFSAVSVVPGNELGKVRAVYAAKQNADETERLLVFEKSAVFSDAFPRGGLDTEEEAEPNEADFHLLIPQANEIFFEYAKREVPSENKERAWQEKWDPDEERDLPVAVKITLKIDPETDPICVVAHIWAEME